MTNTTERSSTAGLGMRLRRLAAPLLAAGLLAGATTAPQSSATAAGSPAGPAVPLVQRVEPVDDAEYANRYTRLIDGLRTMFGSAGTVRPTHPEYAHELTTTAHRLIPVGELADRAPQELQLVVNPSDLYLIGFYVPSRNVVYHFTDHALPANVPPAAVNRVNLHYTGQYADLARNGGTALENVRVGRQTLTNAILAIVRGDPPNRLGRSIQVLAVALAEAARFRTIATRIHNMLVGADTWTVGGAAEIINNWDRLGGAVRRAADNGQWDEANVPIRGQWVSPHWIAIMFYLVKRR